MKLLEYLHVRREAVHEESTHRLVGDPVVKVPEPAEDATSIGIYGEAGFFCSVCKDAIRRLRPNSVDAKQLGAHFSQVFACDELFEASSIADFEPFREGLELLCFCPEVPRGSDKYLDLLNRRRMEGSEIEKADSPEILDRLADVSPGHGLGENRPDNHLCWALGGPPISWPEMSEKLLVDSFELQVRGLPEDVAARRRYGGHVSCP